MKQDIEISRAIILIANIYRALTDVLSTWNFLILTTALWKGKHYYFPPFTDDNIEPQAGSIPETISLVSLYFFLFLSCWPVFFPCSPKPVSLFLKKICDLGKNYVCRGKEKGLMMSRFVLNNLDRINEQRNWKS